MSCAEKETINSVMTRTEYESIKGKLETIDEAFLAGQRVVLAYFADCLNQSLAFNGWDGVLKVVERERCKRMCGI